MINQKHLDDYRKKFEEIKRKEPLKLNDWDKIVYQDYPELVASLMYSLQEFIDSQSTQLPNQKVHVKLTHINEADSDYEYFYTLENND